ncbi:MAG: putative Fe-S oxidoreductase [Thermoplasmatales archaeon]|jgi:MoaA/NifB/PqqE/SkfB family radical SAM enzyme|nr:putative Fe-S oxidoreductase [Thermoplasmatales archaeon]
MKKLPARKYLSTLQYAAMNYLAKECIYPFYASFKVTHICSLKCSFCNVWREKTPDLSKEDVFKVIDNIANSSIVVLSLEGGDPLVRKDLGEILQYAHQKPFYLFFTTNGHLLDKRPMTEYGKHIDYLHISIDEGHGNLEFFDRLEEFQSYGPEICIQIVVTKETLPALEGKVKRVFDVNARTVVMPACHLDGTDDFYPDPMQFQAEILRLKQKYPNTITTPKGFLDNINKPHGCSTSSVIIDSDGGLFYPCRTVGKHLFNFTEDSFMEFLRSDEAKQARVAMDQCNRSCGWYQYFATDVFASPRSLYSSLSPYLLK